MTIQTVTGPAQETGIGVACMHEHLFMLSVGLYDRWPHLLDRQAAVNEVSTKVAAAMALGIQTIVDMTTPNMGRDIGLLREVAQRTGAHIIAATGIHPHEPLPLYLQGVVGDNSDGIDPERHAELFVHDITVGMDGTDIRAGIIKTGSDPVVDESNVRLLRGAALAHLRTGTPISTHTHAGNRVGLDQQDVLAEAGVDLRNVVIGHCGDSSDLGYLRALADRGSVLGMDRFGYTMPGHPAISTAERVRIIAELCRLGYADRMVLSSDSVSWSDVISAEYFNQHLPNWNLTYLPSTVVGLLNAAGVQHEDVAQMMQHTPARVLSPV